DTRLVSNGTHTIRVVAYDTSNNQAQTQITVNVNNPTTTTYPLTVDINPSGAGSVSLNPSGGVYVAGTTVTVLAQANAGWVFSGWSGDLSGSQNPASVVMNSSKTVIANFVSEQVGISTYSLVVNINPEGAGSVILTPPGGVYIAGSTVTILAEAEEGYRFTHWGGDIVSSMNPVNIMMDKDKLVVANFELVSSTVVDSKPRIDSINLVSGSVISGLYRLVVSCSDDVGIDKVELYIDGILVATLTVSPYEYVIDSRVLVNGRHEMMVAVYDSVGQIDSEVIEFIVDNVEVVEKLKGRYLLSVSGDGVNDEIDLGEDVEWVKLYDVKGKIVYEAKNKIGLNTKLGVGVYIYKAKLKTGGIKIGSITVVK
ncbi:MAG: Ig-like domain-containing protein, partial [candidate division WOR-3 bacterium]